MSENNFKVGDRVWHVGDKWGTVTELIPNMRRCPVKVHMDGADSSVDYQANELFFHEFDIPESARTRPEPPKPQYDFKPGDPVIVWSDGDPDTKYVRAFGRQDNICQWDGDKKTWCEWDNCVPYDRTLLGFAADPRDLPEGTKIEVWQHVSDGVMDWCPATLLAVLSDGSAIVHNSSLPKPHRIFPFLYQPTEWRVATKEAK